MFSLNRNSPCFVKPIRNDKDYTGNLYSVGTVQFILSQTTSVGVGVGGGVGGGGGRGENRAYNL